MLKASHHSPLAQLTLQQFLEMPDGDITYEFVQGQLVPKMSPKQFHSTVTLALVLLIRQWCRGRGRVRPEWTIAVSEAWAPVPDLLYVSYERLAAEWNLNQACPVVPELVVEVVSPGQSFGELARKARDYLAAEVLRVWIVDPEIRSITVFYPDAPAQTYTDTMPLVDSLLEGLEITAAQVFEVAELPGQAQ